MKNMFTVDLEDWYQGIDLPLGQWKECEKRIQIGTEKLLNLFTKYNIKATFFVLGKVVEEHPEIIRIIQNENHEIGCHTYTHPFLYKITPTEFEEQLIHCDTLAKKHNIQFKGFRAPFFSLNLDSYWALDILQKYGYQYDSSIFPGKSFRSGIKAFSEDITPLPQSTLLEVPITKIKIAHFQAGTGGAMFRYLPYRIFRKYFAKNQQIRPQNFYIHPWELDPKQPYLSHLPANIKYSHYFNLQNTEKKLNALCNEFQFDTIFATLNKVNELN